jgi:hypothetical protein
MVTPDFVVNTSVPNTVVRSFFALAMGLVILTASAHSASAQNFSRTFAVSSETSDLEVINQLGSIKVAASSSASKIVINARQIDGNTKIETTELGRGKIKVEVTGFGTVDFEITVPSSSHVDLLCYKGAITASNLGGRVRARVTDGNIDFTAFRSPRVEAHSTKGNINFSGEVLPTGNYTLKAFSGRIDATLPSNADFKLSAASYRGGIDLGAFDMKFVKQTDQLVEASYGDGRASVHLWTQEGSIHLHRKP